MKCKKWSSMKIQVNKTKVLKKISEEYEKLTRPE